MSEAEALKNFVCTQCGQCCRIPGYVRVTETDISRIAAFMGISAETCIDQHTRLMPDRSGLSLLEESDGACVHLTEDGTCQLHDAKPEQCQGFPYTWRYPNMESICEGWKI